MQVWCLSASAHPDSFGSFIKRFRDEGREVELRSLYDIISHLVRIDGRPEPPYAKPLRDVDRELNEICSKLNEKELLRIYYFVDRDAKKMVLLNFTIKPRLYEGKLKKRVEKEIHQDIAEALLLKSKYSISPHDYEKI